MPALTDISVKHRRHDFSVDVIRKLRDRVGGLCSNPGCRVPTHAPGKGEDGVSSIGVAAHIHAAAPGGPRYLAAMTKEERRRITNGLWLCSNCSVKVDRDVPGHPAELLRQWKQHAEARATLEQGKPQPQREDGRDELILALTGHASQLLPRAISNVHRGVNEYLQSLDRRFRVTSQHVDGSTQFTLHPLEPVPFTIKVHEQDANQWLRAMQGLRDHGLAARLPLNGTSIHGSPMLVRIVELLGADSEIAMEPIGMPATVRFSVSGNAASEVRHVVDFDSMLFPGVSTFRIEGRAFEGFLQTKLQLPRPGTGIDEHEFEVIVDTARWAGVQVRELPYFNKIDRFLDQLYPGATVDFVIEVRGEELIRGCMETAPGGHVAPSTFPYLRYLRDARTLSQLTSTPIATGRPDQVNAEALGALAQAVRVFEAQEGYASSPKGDELEFTLIASKDADNVRVLSAHQGTSMALRFQYNACYACGANPPGTKRACSW